MYASALVGLAVLVAAPAPKEAPKKDPGIVGEWIAEKMVAGGMEMPLPPGGTATFIFAADGKLIVREGPKEKPDEASYTVDTKKSPAEIDLIPPAKEKMGNMPGIFKIEGDTLTLCFTFMGERPKSFESPAGATTMLMTLKRVKKD
jgi:uncharacterized protein (TIGR03067 family)